MKAMNYKLMVSAALGLVISSNIAFAQNEYFEGSPEWYVTVPGLGFDILQHTYSTNDTLINGITYKQFIQTSPVNQILGQSIPNSNDLLYLVRSIGNTIYYYDTYSSEEQLLFQFEGEVGDTLYTHPLIATINEPTYNGVLILSIDSVQIANEWRTIYEVDDNYFDNNFIYEGIGCTCGLFARVPDWEGAIMNCFTYTDQSYTQTFEFNTPNLLNLIEAECDFDGVSELLDGIFEVFPNPAIDLIQIKNIGNSSISKIKITDTTGRLVMTEYNKQQIDVAHLPGGIYFIEVSTDESRSVLKFVKE